MTDLRVETVRGPMVESIHRVSAAVVDSSGTRVAWSGDPDLVTFWRSAAKPFQAIPIVEGGAAEHFGLTDDELALVCASHSSEPIHLDMIDRLLDQIGCQESDLGCGGHPPLSEEVARALAAEGRSPTQRWSNCSGNHAGMLALAKHRQWPLADYYREGHPVQDCHLDEISRWSGVPVEDIVTGVDGCNTVCFGLPLSAMALAYARLGASTSTAARRIVACMTSHPRIVGGLGRPCTDIMAAGEGEVIAKIGAEGVYGAALTANGLGIALKVEDGGMRSAPIALLAIIRSLVAHGLVSSRVEQWLGRVDAHATVTLTNTKNNVTGMLRPAGDLHFPA